MLISRLFAILSAIMLVSAVALAMLGPADMPLDQLLHALDDDLASRMRIAMQHDLPAWVGRWIATPLLIRPAWLLPASLGLVAMGLSMTLSSRPQTDQPRRRRS